MAPYDRRGLAEIVAWIGASFIVSSVAVVQIIKTGTIDPEIRGVFVGLLTALLARGTKGAIDRDAQRPTIDNGEK